MALSGEMKAGERERLVGEVQQMLGYEPSVRITEMDEIPPAESGKFEDFRSEVDAAPV